MEEKSEKSKEQRRQKGEKIVETVYIRVKNQVLFKIQQN